jgi:glycosyltransferase involved in cell wall biosynthesis
LETVCKRKSFFDLATDECKSVPIRTTRISVFTMVLQDMQTRISVVIVNFNRPHEVKDALQSLLNQSVEPFEIIIIDDASKSPLSIKAADSKVKLIRFDDEAGISGARNYGINVAKGEYVAFIDDDCIASRHWIKEVQSGIMAGGEVLGGPLRPIFRSEPPKWWSEKDLGYFVGVGNSETERIYGANMVFKKEVFQKIGVFNPNLGRQKGKLLGFEDMNLISKAKKSFRVLFLPNAVVFHRVAPQRLNLKYIVRWSYNQGKSIKITLGSNTLVLMRWRAGAFCSFLKAVLRLLNPFTKPKSAKILQVAKMAEAVGIII